MRGFLLLCLSLFFVMAQSQDRTLTLKHKNSGTVYEVDPEKAIKCKLEDGNTKKGYIQSLTDESIVLNGDSINIEKIIFFCCGFIDNFLKLFV